VLQKGEAEHRHECMAGKTLPGSRFEVVEPKFLFELLMGLLADPSSLDCGDVAPNFYPAAIGAWTLVMPCWAVVAAGRGAEPSVERSAANRRYAAWVAGLSQPSRECGLS
jgi:hypothetical protein